MDKGGPIPHGFGCGGPLPHGFTIVGLGCNVILTATMVGGWLHRRRRWWPLPHGSDGGCHLPCKSTTAGLRCGKVSTTTMVGDELHRPQWLGFQFFLNFFFSFCFCRWTTLAPRMRKSLFHELVLPACQNFFFYTHLGVGSCHLLLWK